MCDISNNLQILQALHYGYVPLKNKMKEPIICLFKNKNVSLSNLKNK